MNLSVAGATIALPILSLLVAAPATGALVTRSLFVGVGLPIGIFAVLILDLSLGNRVAHWRGALGVCTLVICFPAFLPRPQADRLAPAFGGGIDAKAKGMLVVVVVVAVAAALLWLATVGASAALARPPLDRFSAYAVVIVFSLTFAPDPAWAAFAALRLIEVVLVIAVLVALVRIPGQLKRMIDAMLAGIGVVLIAYWFDIPRGAAWQQDGWTSTSWIHLDAIAALAGTFTVVATTRFVTVTSSRSTPAADTLSAFGAATVVMASGKSAFGGAILGSAVTLMATVCKGTGPKAGRLLAVCVAAAGAAYYAVSGNVRIAACSLSMPNGRVDLSVKRTEL